MPAIATANQNSAMPEAEAEISIALASAAQRSACTTLDPGPAAATHSMSRLGWRRLPKFTGTGLAQPKRMPPTIIEISGKTMVPTGSMCLAGFNVTRPSMYAVLSPNILAT